MRWPTRRGVTAKVWAMVRYDGHRVSAATVLRLLRDEGLLLEANYQRERRELAASRRAAHAEAYRVEDNTVRPHEAIAWNHPIDVHLGHADPATPNLPEPQNLPS